MLVYLLFCILLVWIFYKFTRSMEIRDGGKWEPFTLPIWIWIIIILVALIPILNIAGLLVFIVICIADARSDWPEARFSKENIIYNFTNKILNLLTKEF